MLSDTELQRLFETLPFHRNFAFTVSAREDGVMLAGEFDERQARDAKTVHGGAIAALLDTALTLAMWIGTQRQFATVDLRVDYLQFVAMGRATVIGRVVHASRTLGRAAAELRDASGGLCASAVGTFAAVDRRPPGSSEPLASP